MTGVVVFLLFSSFLLKLSSCNPSLCQDSGSEAGSERDQGTSRHDGGKQGSPLGESVLQYMAASNESYGWQQRLLSFSLRLPPPPSNIAQGILERNSLFFFRLFHVHFFCNADETLVDPDDDDEETIEIAETVQQIREEQSKRRADNTEDDTRKGDPKDAVEVSCRQTCLSTECITTS